jgi:hypothetical protein
VFLSVAGDMAFAAAGNRKVGRMGFASRCIVFLAIFAFALQTYMVQTHIHPDGQGTAALARTAAAAGSAHHKAPLDNSPLTCPFCQSFTLAGAVLLPVMLLLHLPLVWVESVPLAFTARAFGALPAHDWQTRAPPRV